MTRATALLLLAAAGASASAEEPRTLSLTLEEAVERALSSSAKLGQLRALADAASAAARAARAARLPQAELSLGYARNSDVPELRLATPGGPPRTIFPNIPDNYRARLAASVPLYTGGRLQGLLDAAEAEREAVGGDVVGARAELVLETSAAYWSLVTSRESARVLGEALAAYDAHLWDARNRERLGMAARNEVLAVQVERDRAELARLRATHGADVAQASLARLLNAEPGSRIEAREPLERAPEPPEPLERLVSAARDLRPERAALLARIGAAEARVRAERAARLPQLLASVAYDYANPNRKILPPEAQWNDTWDVSLGVSLNLFDGGRVSAAVAQARAHADALRRQLEDLERRIRLEVTQRLAELETAGAAVLVAERGLEAARENRRVAADRYREGVIASAELLDAEVALLRAGLDRTEALAQARLAAAGLARAAGR